MSLDTERHEREGDERLSQLTREEYEAAIADIEREKQALMQAAREALTRIAAMHPRVIDRRDWRTRSPIKLEVIEVAEDVADGVADAFSAGLDEAELALMTNALETGRA
jgi:hypothetical protein